VLAVELGRLAARSPARGPVFVGVILALLAAAYWPTVRELSGFGSRTDGQFLIVFCAFAGLVWSRRHALEQIPLRPFWPALAGLLLLAFFWLVGQVAYVRVLADVSVVLMVPAAILAVGGLQWAAALAFPLAFLAFAIPLDQLLAPTLAEWTAQVTIALLQAVGVPVEREGAYFTVPTGRWVVADACAGVKYLTSCLIVAVLLAPALFRSAGKRTAFVLGAIVLAVTGNWLRAFLTVWVAHLTNNQWLRDDHGDFGWLLYASLFLLYCLAWWRWRDDPLKDRLLFADGRGLETSTSASTARVAACAIAAVAIVLGAPLASQATSARDNAGPVAQKLLVAEADGWRHATGPASQWRPQIQNAGMNHRQSFEKDGRKVDLHVAGFQRENWDAKLVSVANTFVVPGDPSWALASRSPARIELTGQSVTATQALMEGPGTRVLAWQWYWVDGLATGSGLRAKLAQLRSRFGNGPRQWAWVAISAQADDAAHLQAFTREMGPAIHRALASR
jgi:EpsI family protein